MSEDGTLKQNYFRQHFLNQKNHGLLDDCEMRLTDKTDPSDSTRREFCWMGKLKTLAPLGLSGRCIRLLSYHCNVQRRYIDLHLTCCTSSRSASATASYFTEFSELMTPFALKNHYFANAVIYGKFCHYFTQLIFI